MSFGERIKFRRGELKLSRGELAGRLGVSPSAVSNYENGLSFPKEDVMLRLFDSLETDPNQLFRDSFRGGGQALSSEEQTLLRKFRELSPLGRETVQSVTEALWACRQETSPLPAERPEGRIIFRNGRCISNRITPHFVGFSVFTQRRAARSRSYQ